MSIEKVGTGEGGALHLHCMSGVILFFFRFSVFGKYLADGQYRGFKGDGSLPCQLPACFVAGVVRLNTFSFQSSRLPSVRTVASHVLPDGAFPSPSTSLDSSGAHSALNSTLVLTIIHHAPMTGYHAITIRVPCRLSLMKRPQP
jgi:hypothetical protein